VPGPLQGLRVLDFTQYVAGPYCTMLLADLGAEVIKVEPPTTGDIYRRQGPHYIAGESTSFLSLNRNKKSLTLNLRSAHAREVVQRLVSAVDALVENSRPGTLERLGLGYDDLQSINPRLIYVSISAFGQTGPLSREGGYDLVLQAFTGLMGMTGEPGGRPNKIPIAALDFGAGMLGVIGLLSAWIARTHSGRGQHVDTSLLECAVSWLGMHVLDYSASGVLPAPAGSSSPFFAPYQAFRTADGFIVIVGTGSGDTWPRLCRALGIDDLVERPEFATNAARVKNRQALAEVLESALMRRGSEYWLEHLRAASIVCAPVRTFDRLLEDEHVRHRELIQYVAHPTAGRMPMAAVPMTFSETPGRLASPPPALGAQTRDLLLAAGYGEREIDTLHTEGVI
jgi:crotonobetainyl-CoA:carnitine CoA-transferase CaiB-like acyl-CoA transferase